MSSQWGARGKGHCDECGQEFQLVYTDAIAQGNGTRHKESAVRGFKEDGRSTGEDQGEGCTPGARILRLGPDPRHSPPLNSGFEGSAGNRDPGVRGHPQRQEALPTERATEDNFTRGHKIAIEIVANDEGKERKPETTKTRRVRFVPQKFRRQRAKDDPTNYSWTAMGRGKRDECKKEDMEMLIPLQDSEIFRIQFGVNTQDFENVTVRPANRQGERMEVGKIEQEIMMVLDVLPEDELRNTSVAAPTQTTYSKISAESGDLNNCNKK